MYFEIVSLQVLYYVIVWVYVTWICGVMYYIFFRSLCKVVWANQVFVVRKWNL